MLEVRGNVVSVRFSLSYSIKDQWMLLSLSTHFKWLALRLGLGTLCMNTNSAFLSQRF